MTWSSLADHGELFGDHGLWEKGCFFYEGLVNTPLMITGPGIATTDSLVSDVDLAPTLCARCGIEPDPFMQGIDQSALLADPIRQLRYRCLIECRSGYGEADFASAVLVTREAKYARYQNGEEEYTDLIADPEERRNVAAEAAYRERVDAARQALLDELLATQPRHPAQHCHA